MAISGRGYPCPLWVRSRHVHCKQSCPLYPQKQTCAVQLGMSALPKADILRVRSRGQRLRFFQKKGRKLLVFFQELLDVIFHRDIGMDKRPKMSGSDKSE
jgi:hypothetical protein